MKKIFKNISTQAALLIALAAFSACSREDSEIISELPTIEQTPQVYNLTIDASMGNDAQKRALELDGTKLVAKWANDETVDVRSGSTLLGTLTVSNVSADGKTCTLSGTLTGTIGKGDKLYFYYNYSGTLVNESQTGTLASTAGSDYAMTPVTVKSVDGGNITLESEPSFQTQVAVLKITMQDALANKLNATSLKIKIGDKDLCTLSPSATAYSENGAGVVYFALPSAHRVYTEGISSIGLDEEELAAATVTFTATVGGNTYITTKTGYPFAAGKYYATTLTMAKLTDLSTISGTEYTVQNGEVLTGTLANNVKISIADGATVTLKDVNINGSGTWTDGYYAGITCAGTAIINLEGTNTVKGFINTYPGIYVPENETLTINGPGSLKASTGGTHGSGIGGIHWGSCGNITINGGTIIAEGGAAAAAIGSGMASSCGDITITGGNVTAIGNINNDWRGVGIGCGDGGSDGQTTYRAKCGNITISGGTVTAIGKNGGVGIGSGLYGDCGTITITSGVTSVTATKGSGATNSIGAGDGGTCGTVTIEDASKVTQN